MDEARMRSLMTPKMQRRIDNIDEVRRLRPTVSQHDAVRALNVARDDVSLACRLLPQVCEDSARRREAARRRQRDKYAEIDFLEGDEVMVRGLQSRAELNGGLGVVQRFNAKRGRYIVLLEQTGTTVAVKGINLEPLDDGGLADHESSAESDSSEEGCTAQPECSSSDSMMPKPQPELPEPEPPAAAAGMHGSFRSRVVMYVLIAMFEMTNYVTRLAVPYLVPFIVREYGFTEQQRALLLNSFTPGYVVGQIPCGWLIERSGTKAVVTGNCVGLVAVMLGLPFAARAGGARAVSSCLVLFGLLQSSFAPALWTMKATWIPQGPERAWALMVSGFGTTLAKNIASVVTPWLSGRSGWHTAACVYAAAVGLYTIAWQLLARERPKPSNNTGDNGPGAKASTRRKFGPMALMLAPPCIANTFLHMVHDLSEMQVLAFWAPTYFNQVLGVEMHLVGAYTSWPMLCAIPSKVLVASWETQCYRKGYSLRQIRKLGSLICATITIPSGILFMVLSHPVAATIAYCGFVSGQVFDAAVVLPNKLEIGGEHDMPIIASFSSTAAWTSGLACASLLSFLKQRTGSWVPLFGAPLLLRLIGTAMYCRHVTVKPLRDYLEVAPKQRRSYLEAQGREPTPTSKLKY